MQSSVVAPKPKEPKHRSVVGVALGDLPLVAAQFLLLAAAFSLAGHHLFSEDDRIHPSYVIGAAFVSFMIVAWEVKVLLKSMYWKRGVQLLRLVGLDLEPDKGGWWKLLIAGLIRLLMAFILSSIMALCMTSAFFAKDERAILERLARQQNAGLEEAAARTVDARISGMRTALGDARARASSLTPKVTTLTVQAVRSRLRRDGLDQLPVLQSALAGAESRAVQLQAELDHLMATREEVIKAQVANAPNYVPPETGLLAEMKALSILASENPHARTVILAFQASLLCLELILFASKLIDMSPSGYDGFYAYKIYSEARRLAKRLSEELEASEESPPFPPPPADLVPPANDNSPAAMDEPFFGALVAGKQADGLDEPPPIPPRRPRGRPRKNLN